MRVVQRWTRARACVCSRIPNTSTFANDHILFLTPTDCATCTRVNHEIGRISLINDQSFPIPSMSLHSSRSSLLRVAVTFSFGVEQIYQITRVKTRNIICFTWTTSPRSVCTDRSSSTRDEPTETRRVSSRVLLTVWLSRSTKALRPSDIGCE